MVVKGRVGHQARALLLVSVFNDKKRSRNNGTVLRCDGSVAVGWPH